MKIAISTRGENLDAPFDYRFNQAAHVLVIDSKKLQYHKLPILEHKAKIPSDKELARSLIDYGVNVVVTGMCSDRVSEMLDDAHVRLYDGRDGSVKDNVADYYKNRLIPKISEHYSIDESFDVGTSDTNIDDLWELIPGHIPEQE